MSDSPIKSTETEGERINRLVKERILEAEKKGIRKLSEDMYAEAQQIASYFKHSHRDFIPSIVVSAIEDKVMIDEKKHQLVTKLTFENGVLSFTFKKTGDYDGIDYGELLLDWNSETVLTLGMSLDSDSGTEYSSPEWKSFQIKSYIPGDWETILKELKLGIANNKSEREKKNKEDPLKIAEMKKKFGL